MDNRALFFALTRDGLTADTARDIQ